MSNQSGINRRIVLRSRPTGAPVADNFELQQQPIPEPSSGQVLLKTLYLSLDPYMRSRMNDAKSYAPPVGIGEVMVGGTVCRVEASQNPDFRIGDTVLAFTGWQDYAVSDGKGLMKLDRMPNTTLALGVLGMPGFTAYMGLIDIGQPRAGETVVVAAASGAVGSAVGQIAKLKGCHVVGIAGGPDKCRYCLDELGFDVCIDRHSGRLRDELSAACPKGIDVYFENVGGAVFEAVMPLLNTKARIPLCGLIANYNDTALPAGPNRLPQLASLMLTRRIKMQGYIITEDYRHRFGEFFKEMSTWVSEGKIKFREDIVNGLENAPSAFIGLLTGKNFGKLIIKVEA